MWAIDRGDLIYLGFCNCVGGIKDNGGLNFVKTFHPVETTSSGNCIHCGHAAFFKGVTKKTYEKKHWDDPELTNQKRLKRIMAAIKGKKQHTKMQKERLRKMSEERKRQKRLRSKDSSSSFAATELGQDN
jgi:hypothetical protein